MQLQDTDSGTEIMHMAENGFCEHGEQEKLLREGAPVSMAPCPSIPMAAVSPMANLWAPQACARSMKSACSCAAKVVHDRCPIKPKVGYTHVYGAPGISGVNIITK